MNKVPPEFKFRCPLCLRRLRGGQQLILFKSASAESESEEPSIVTIDCQDGFMEQVTEFVGKLENNIRGGVFVSHVNCDGKNPFFKDGKIQIPGNLVDDGERCVLDGVVCAVTGKAYPADVRHWIIRMLRETSRYSEKHDAMWYPYLLLAATASVDRMDIVRPFGNLIELAGTRRVGKTILTIQMMHEDLFSRGLRSFEYFFPRGLEGNPFYEELITFAAWKEQPSFRPPGTLRTPGDLRAAFIERIPPKNTPAAKKTRTRKPSLMGWFVNLMHEFSEMLGARRRDVDANSKTFRFQPSKKWVPILLYDSAGEASQEFPERTRRLRDLTNKIAICIDAEELVNRASPPNSIKHARERLNLALLESDSRKRRTAIVVTKADMLQKTLSTADATLLNDLWKGGSRASERGRKLLLSLLQRRPTNDGAALTEFLSKTPIVDAVFFVGTINLPLMNGIRFSPIGSFEPVSAKKRKRITIKANKYYRFQMNGDVPASAGTTNPPTDEDLDDQLRSATPDSTELDVKAIRFNDRSAEFTVINSKTIEATVPDNSSRGFIGIISERREGTPPQLVRDDANSSELFNVIDISDKESLKPKSFGLTSFLAWCGGIEESEIVRDLNVSESEESGLKG